MDGENVKSARRLYAALCCVANDGLIPGFRVACLEDVARQLAAGAFVPVMDSARWASMIDPEAMRDITCGGSDAHALACAVRVSLAYGDQSGLAGLGYEVRR